MKSVDVAWLRVRACDEAIVVRSRSCISDLVLEPVCVRWSCLPAKAQQAVQVTGDGTKHVCSRANAVYAAQGQSSDDIHTSVTVLYRVCCCT